MAMGIRFICSRCKFSIRAWDDGNPYYIDENGDKQYAYHPSEEVNKCIGNDSPHLCLSCGEQFMVDSRAPISQCPKCASSDISDTFHLRAKKCPFCEKGRLLQDISFSAVS